MDWQWESGRKSRPKLLSDPANLGSLDSHGIAPPADLKHTAGYAPKVERAKANGGKGEF